MKQKKKLGDKLSNIKVVNRIINDIDYRILLFATISFICNLIFALYNGITGFVSQSIWFIIIGLYYLVLCLMRFILIIVRRRDIDTAGERDRYNILPITGLMIVILSVALAMSVVINIKNSIAYKYDVIFMIAIATYAFTKLGISIFNVVKVKKTDNSDVIIAIRNIGFADAIASIISLQRSMLVSFDGADAEEILTMNIITGTIGCVVIFLIGAWMIIGKNKASK